MESIIYDKSADTRAQKKQCIINFKSYYTESKVRFVLTFRKNELKEFISNNELYDLLKLKESKNSSYSNMHLYNENGTIEKFNNVEEILRKYCNLRLEYYTKRKEYLLNKYKEELKVISAKIRFIREFINKDIDIINQDDDVIYQQLIDRDYPIIDNDTKFDYLLNMSIRTLTKKKMNELQKEYDTKTKVMVDLEKNPIRNCGKKIY